MATATYGTFGDEPDQHPVHRVKAPWKLKAECYTLLLRLKELPKGAYDAFEEAWGGEEFGTFAGGLGTVMIVRYSETPVGPYDELMFVPGNFSVPQPPTADGPKIPKKALRISRIYVSQRTTAYNGRLNWNIPKHLARFTFSAPPTPPGHSPPQSLTVQVFPPSSNSTADNDATTTPPFFACTLKPWQWIPPLPVNTKYIPLSLVIAQPPIPEFEGYKAAARKAIEETQKTDEYDLDPTKAGAVLPGTEKWRAFEVSATSPRARGCWVEVHGKDRVEGVGEGEGGESKVFWPEGLGTWRVGAWMEDVNWVLGEVKEWM